jgi:hypothetical protein
VKVSVEFEWEASPGAKSYRIQVASDAEFKQILIDQTVQQEKYEYQTDAPKKESQVYFRVAAIGENGAQSGFSSAETITVRPQPEYHALVPEPTPTPSPVRQTKKKSIEKPKHPIVKKQPEREMPKPQAPTKVTKKTVVLEKNWFFELSYGIAYQHRKFKSDAQPATAEGSGLIPMQLDARLSFFKPESHYYQLDLSLISEKAQPKQADSPWGDKLNVPSIKARAAQLHPWQNLYWGAGVYLANSSKIQWIAPELTSSQAILVGASLSLSSDPLDERYLRWQVEANPIFIGSMGFDFRGRVQKNLSGFSGAFVGGEVSARITGIETGYAGALQLGYIF